ncbi:hypothetical protein LTR10_016091 [Elasticomyces elasticus]|uniref:Transcription factor domain-containing protein n=1 Tax=Exophiala sideris TaxID=1016849 RepID=A0ABR0IWE3_9EURO|nr:hypothetical protein LTR10_016091 [Elasticomyces elasticus]KAK5021540.1 hypothetical protein LTS07_010947 [Exophiala sideris]KAK5024540.1 hypothetical protein LTR13_010796 [Exophiala sideris]KAK5049675.1 hypothetical protein LTR69_010971 [Exophiala sideris]KAK5176656.1 hypothetical protein LTR44_010838 [Eurotiomycetes sp. CCFEE 6388]
MFRVEDPTSFAEGVNRDRRRRRGANTTQPSSRQTSKSPANTSDLGAPVAPLGQVTLTRSSSQAQGTPESSPPKEDLAIQLADSMVALASLVSPPRPLAESWETHMMPFCFDNLMQRRSPQTQLYFLGFLPDMVVELGRDSSVGLACQAISWAFLTNRTRAPEAVSKRTMTYGQALAMTNVALRDPSLQTRDDTLASVYLLSLYELLVGSSTTQHDVGPATWVLHTQGLTSLLRLRGHVRFNSIAGRNLFWLVYSSIQIRCLIVGSECPPESLTWFRELERNLAEEDLPSLEVAKYGYHVAALCARIRACLEGDKIDSPTLAFAVCEESDRLDADAYDSSIPRPDTYERHTPAGPSDSPVPDLRSVTSRTSYCGFRLKLHLCIWELLAKTQALFPGVDAGVIAHRLQQHVLQIQRVADELLGSVPSIFCSDDGTDRGKNSRPIYWVDALRLLWPLRLVVFFNPTRPDQKQSAGASLRRIREKLGVEQATQTFVRWRQMSN